MRAEAEGARALARLRSARPPAELAAGHERIVADYAALLEAQSAHRRAALARDRAEALATWRSAERRGRKLQAAIDRAFA